MNTNAKPFMILIGLGILLFLVFNFNTEEQTPEHTTTPAIQPHPLKQVMQDRRSSISVELKGTRPNAFGWCLAMVEITANRDIDFFGISVFALDSNNNVIESDVGHITMLPSGRSRLMEFSFPDATCNRIAHVRWEPM